MPDNNPFFNINHNSDKIQKNIEILPIIHTVKYFDKNFIKNICSVEF